MASSARDVILFSTADWDEPYWTNKQHTARELTERGCRVLYVESVGIRRPALGSRRDRSRLWRRLKSGLTGVISGPRQRAHGLWVLSPLTIPVKQHWHVIAKINQGLLRWTISRFMHAQGFTRPIVWVYHPWLPVPVCSAACGPLVYHCVDDLGAVPGVDRAAFIEAQERLLERCDLVFATARSLAETCGKVNHRTHFFPNVVDSEHFGQALEPGPIPEDIAAIPHPRLIYHGVISDFKLDFPFLLNMVRRRPDWHWILIGKEREGQADPVFAELSALPNVHCLGYRPYTALPDYLRGMDLGVLPSRINEYTDGMFPMKYFEYLAAGLRVVSTPLAFTREHHAGLLTAETPESFDAAVQTQLDAGRVDSRTAQKWVGDNTWQARTGKMLALIEQLEVAA